MSDTTKVTLSAGQLAIASDANLILTKRAIMETASALFSSQVPSLNELFTILLSGFQDIHSCIPKITKGENYNGFPYVIMDYPAAFEKENIFALRTMFWWGNFISITLHLSGKYKLAFEQNILKQNQPLKDFYIAVADTEWQHHFQEDNYVPFSKITEEGLEKIRQRNFLKIALKYELHHWNMMQTLLPEGYKIIKGILFS